MQITPEEVKKGSNMIEEVEGSRAAYYSAKGDSQDSSEQKDKANKFYAMAKLALEDQPELLESLAKS